MASQGKGEKKKKGKPLHPSRILYEDNHLIAVLKNPGDIVQGDKTGDPPLSLEVEEYIRKQYEKEGNVYLGVIHRLDRPVSGVILFAKTGKGLSRMNKAFQEKAVEKVYWAVAQGGHEGKGRLEDRLLKDERKNRSRIVESDSRGKEAVLDYEVVGKGEHYSFIEIFPGTGRHHQIRVQLAARGMSIKGDVKYGARRPNKDASIHLHARMLRFPHPTRDEMIRILAPPPKGDPLWELFLKERPDHS